MRVITGKARGVQLKTPDGLTTRPTTDRVKEALFSIIQFDEFEAFGQFQFQIFLIIVGRQVACNCFDCNFFQFNDFFFSYVYCVVNFNVQSFVNDCSEYQFIGCVEEICIGKQLSSSFSSKFRGKSC